MKQLFKNAKIYDGTGADPAETGRRHLTANQWWQVWERVLEKLEAK